MSHNTFISIIFFSGMILVLLITLGLLSWQQAKARRMERQARYEAYEKQRKL